MRALIDTNVVLDFLQEREPFAEDAVRLFAQIDAGDIQGFIAATTITNIYYIVRKMAGIDAAQDAIAQILLDLNLCAVDASIIQQAIALNFQDFEDAVQYVCGLAHNVDVIITRDRTGFANASIPVISPAELETF